MIEASWSDIFKLIVFLLAFAIFIKLIFGSSDDKEE